MYVCVSVCVYIYIIQIWHRCGVANMIVYPKWALSPLGYALGWQCSQGVDYHVGNPTVMPYLFYYTEQPPSPLGTLNLWQVETHLGSAISEQQVYCADHAGMSYLLYHTEQPTISTRLRFYFFLYIETLAHLIFFIVVLNNNIIPLLTVAFCSCIDTYRHAWGSWKHDVLNNIGNHETAPWQRVVIRRLLDSGC